MAPEMEGQEPVKDPVRLLWWGIAIGFVVMIALLFFMVKPPRPHGSQVHTRHILIRYDRQDPADRTRALELITDLRNRILEGEDFAKLAREYSDDTVSARRGGDLGFYPRNSFVKGYEEYAWEAPVGELSEVISTEHGFHLIIVEERFISETDQYEAALEQRAREALENKNASPADKTQGAGAASE